MKYNNTIYAYLTIYINKNINILIKCSARVSEVCCDVLLAVVQQSTGAGPDTAGPSA